MKSFKFRVWDTIANSWYKSDQLVLRPNGTITDGSLLLTGDTVEFHMGTGIVDKNGIEIFEYDILKVNRHHLEKITYDRIEDGEMTGLVCHNGERFFISYDHVIYDDSDDLYRTPNRYEIIGNRFENPDLIEYK
jgi:uncharacterized phage protein (TIGR01671 family)